MKLLHVITTMNPKAGGPSQGLRNINPLLKLAGLDVEVLCLDHPDTNFDANNPIAKIKLGQGHTSFQYNSKLIPWLRANLSRYDVVSVHGLWQYNNFAVHKVIREFKHQNLKTPKVVIMPHGMLDPYFQTAADRKYKSIRNQIVWHLIQKHAINAADAIFFTCQEELELARTTFRGYKPKNEVNVGYGIQRPPIFTATMKELFEQSVPALKGKRYWLFLSRIDPKKGIDVMIKSYQQLALENPDIPDLLIAGPVETPYAKKMVLLADKNEKIHFSGMLTGDVKWGAFYSCDTFILPSHQENYGIAIVEAMACQKPVLITKKVNIWREIDLGGGGWIINTPTYNELYAILNQIGQLSHDEIIAKGKLAFHTFETYFLVDRCYTNFLRGIQNIK